MMMTASATAPSPSSPPNMTSGRNHDRRHRRSSSGSSFSFSDERGLGAFTPLSNLPRRARSVHRPADADSTPRETPITASPPSAPLARSLSASTTPRASIGLTTPVSPSRVKKASFTFGSSSDDDDEDCPLVREVNQRARMAKISTEVDHFGDFSFDAEAHKAKTSRLSTTDEADTETETETEADFPRTPVGDAAPTTPRLTVSTNIPVVPFPVLSPSPVRSTLPLPPLSIPDAPASSPVVRSASSPFLSSPSPKLESKNPGLRIGIPSSASSTSPYNSGTSTPILLKNGRPLKPSLKSRVNLSMSTPDVSSMLSQSKSAPGTPRVHFPTRERLESVVLFDKRARPLEVAAGDSPIASPRGFFDDMDGTPGLRIRSQSSFPFPALSPRGSPLGSTANLQGLSAAIMAKTKLKIAISRSAPLQPIPRPEAHVHLAAMRLLATRLSGSVLVKNVSFSKKVVLRYTFDNWETTSEVSGMWSSPHALKDLPSSGSSTEVKAPGNEETEIDVARGILVPTPEGWDRFIFNIKLDDVAPYLSKRPMLLAVKFEAAGAGEWWDNCGGINYRFEFDHVPKTEAPKVEPAPVTPPVVFTRPRSNTSPAPLNTDATQTDLPSATLLSAKLNSVVDQQTPEPVERITRPNLKLSFPSDETITPVPADLTADLGAELAAPKATALGAPAVKQQVMTLTPPDSTSSSPRELPVALPPSTVPAASLPSPAESPASRRQSSPLPSPSAIDAPAHSTTNVKDQSYADFLAKYCFAGASPAAPPTRPAAPSPNFGSSFAAPPPSNSTWGSPTPNFGWGSTAPAHQSWGGGVGFQYGRSTQSYTGGDL